MLDTIVVIIQMREGFTHPNRNLDAPVDGSYRFSGEIRALAPIGVAVSYSFWFWWNKYPCGFSEKRLISRVTVTAQEALSMHLVDETGKK